MKWEPLLKPILPQSQGEWEQIERQNTARLFRGLQEGAGYVFALDTDSARPFYWVFNPLSGETYQTDSFGCSCPDYLYRCQNLAYAGVHCKHIHALFYAMEHGAIVPLAEVIGKTQSIAERLPTRHVSSIEEARP